MHKHVHNTEEDNAVGAYICDIIGVQVIYLHSSNIDIQLI